MDGQCIDVVSTSATTADATPIVLSETDRMRFRFVPMIVNNQSSPECTVRGKILFERKPQNDNFFPTDNVTPCERVTRGSAKKGDWIELELHSKETYNLFMGLKRLYDLSGCMDGIPWISSSTKRLLRSLTYITKPKPVLHGSEKSKTKGFIAD